MIDQLHRHELKNGLRILHRPAPGEIVHCALLIDAGTRDEPENSEGLAHFIEHVLFKGTIRFRPLQVISRLDAVGGELNAWTTKEEICLYTSSAKQHLARAVDLLAEILQHSTFDAGELEKEKEVIAEEIRMYLDSPSENILDEFESRVFRKHPLGRNILGTEKSLRGLKRSDVQAFVREHFTASRIVFCTTGDVPFTQIIQLAEKHFSELPAGHTTRRRQKYRHYKAHTGHIVRDVHQAHCVLGGIAPDTFDPKRTAATMLLNLLGGPAMNSRLNIAIRERSGLAYSVEAQYNCWSDNGLFHIYFGTDLKQLDRCRTIVDRELKKLREKPLSPAQLRAAQKQLQGQIALAQDGKFNVIMAYARSILLHNRIIGPEEIYRRIEAVDSKSLQSLANELFDPKQMSGLSYAQK